MFLPSPYANEGLKSSEILRREDYLLISWEAANFKQQNLINEELTLTFDFKKVVKTLVCCKTLVSVCCFLGKVPVYDLCRKAQLFVCLARIDQFDCEVAIITMFIMVEK